MNWRALALGSLAIVAAGCCCDDFAGSRDSTAAPGDDSGAAASFRLGPIGFQGGRFVVFSKWPDETQSREAAEKDLAERFKVYVADKETVERLNVSGEFAPGDQPPLSGDYTHERSGALAPKGFVSAIFVPDFPLEPGLSYIGVLRDAKSGKQLAQAFTVEQASAAPSSMVRDVYPSSDVLPENLLKFYIHFSEPMRRGEVYQYIDLVDGKGRAVDIPFLEVAEELWNPDGTRLTLFIDPGRVKREVKPLEDVGPAMVEGGRYSLVISSDWPDQNGAPMKREFRKEFQVGPPDRAQPDIKQWQLTLPKAGTRDSLVVDFGESMERALLDRLLWVENPDGAELKGRIEVSNHEARWEFAPDTPWREGRHRLVADEWLEDLAGNRIGRPFEVDIFDKVTKRIEVKSVTRTFDVAN